MDLFDKLKSEPAVEKIVRKSKSNVDVSNNRHESLPITGASLSTSTTQVNRTNRSTTKSKSRSLSPSKPETMNTPNKQVRVMVERTKLPGTPVTPFKNVTPTKAQQKQFDPAVLRKAQELQKFRVKPCFVRIKRVYANKINTSHSAKLSTQIKGKTTKRAHSMQGSPEPSSPPAKKSKSDKNAIKEFHVKLSPQSRKTSISFQRKDHKEWPKIKTPESKKKLSVTPTKFTRTQLIQKFGKKYFSAVVKVERCQHPMMVAFDSEAREQRSKRNKSKNLSVSFHNQVEVYGISQKKRSGKKAVKKKDEMPDTAVPLLPARLQKIENGKVVNEIELDQSMFLNNSTENLTASTPINSNKNSKILPLKDENTLLHGRKHLKLADEKMPQFALDISMLTTTQNDDDEDVEFIVPELEIPEKLKSSFSSSTNLNSTLAETNNETNAKNTKSRLSASPPKASPPKVVQKKATPTRTPPSKPVKSTPSKNKETSDTPAKSTVATKSVEKTPSPTIKTPPKVIESGTSEAGKSTAITPIKESSPNSTKPIETNTVVADIDNEANKLKETSEENKDIPSEIAELKSESSETAVKEETKTKPDTNVELSGNDNANTSGDSFLSAVAEIIENTLDDFKVKSHVDAENNRNRVETETISESSNASTDVQIASSETSNTTIQKSIDTNSKSSPKQISRQQSSSNLDAERPDASTEQTPEKSIVMEPLKYDETNDEQEKDNTQSANDKKSLTNETLDAVEIALKTFTSNIVTKAIDIAEGVTATVNTIMELPINLLAEDTESSSDVNNKVENIIAELSKDSDKVAESTEPSSSALNSTTN